MKYLGFFSLLILGLVACQSDSKVDSQPEKSLTEIKAGEKIKNSELVRNPISAEMPDDTINVAKMQFDTELYEFGNVKQGAKVDHTFTFTNVGTQPLIISNARSTCGCTVPEWPKEPIAPGESGTISVSFDTKGKKDIQKKPVIVTANTWPKETRVHISGFVEAPDTPK